MDEASTPPAHVLEWISIVASIASLVLAGLAIWMSLHFYDKGKHTDKSVAIALSKIDASTATMERVLGQQVSALVEAVSKPDKNLTQVIDQLPGILAAAVSNTNQPPQPITPNDPDGDRLAYIRACWHARAWSTTAGTLAMYLRINKEVGPRTEEELHQLDGMIEACDRERSFYEGSMKEQDQNLVRQVAGYTTEELRRLDLSWVAMGAEYRKARSSTLGEDEETST